MIALGYFNYFKELLAPLGIYDLESGAGKSELELIGCELDRIYDALEEFGREAVPLTAESYGLLNYEELFPYMPSYITTQDRQRAATALLRIRNGCFTASALCDTLRGCGINAVVAESEKHMTVVVSFPDNRGIPDGIDALKQRIEQILPCHLDIEYHYNYSVWNELMKLLPDWKALEAKCPTWRELEIYE